MPTLQYSNNTHISHLKAEGARCPIGSSKSFRMMIFNTKTGSMGSFAVPSPEYMHVRHADRISS